MEIRRELLEALVDSGECWFDHNGDCQEHGYGLLAGELCPQAELKALLVVQREPWTVESIRALPHVHEEAFQTADPGLALRWIKLIDEDGHQRAWESKRRGPWTEITT